MKEIFHTFTNRNARWRFTHSLLFKLVAGCLSLIFIAVCIGTLVVLFLLPTR